MRTLTKSFIFFVALGVLLALALTACGGGTAPSQATTAPSQATTAPSQATTAPSQPTTASTGQKVTINWWHITTKDPGLSIWQKMANDYMAAHPNVDIKITVLENEAFKTKLTTVLQSGTPPDIYQSWGGGDMNQQIQAGLMKDITPDLDANGGAWRKTFAPGALAVYSYQGKNYGVPWDMGMVGWWYNKDLFTKAGIATPPTTWTDFIADVKKLKATSITPICLGEGDKWPGMHIWSYLATRIGGQAAFDAAVSRKGSFADPPFVQAGDKLKELIALDPFQPGYLSATHDEMQGTFGNGKCAMELSGQWAPSVEAANAADKKGVANLGLFNFPAVEGGAGDVSDVVGGGNGFGIGKNAPPEAIQFVQYLTSVQNQQVLAAANQNIPVVMGAETALKDPNMVLVQKDFSAAKYFQLYYDQYLPPAMGSVLNDSVQGLYAGTSTPQQVAQTIEDAAKKNLK